MTVDGEMTRKDPLIILLGIAQLVCVCQSQPAHSEPVYSSQKKYIQAPGSVLAVPAPQTLPIVRIPEKLSKLDEQALRFVSQTSITPVRKGIFPDYRPRSLAEDQNPLSAWTAKDYKAITSLRDLSDEWRQLTRDQLVAMESLLGGVNNHGMLMDLKQRAEGMPKGLTRLSIDGDDVDSLLSAAPASWLSVIEKAKKVRGNQVQDFEIAELESCFGKAQTKQFLSTFFKLEQEKGRPHEVWVLGLAEDGFQEKLIALKQQLRPLGCEAFALESEPKRVFFPTREEAERYAKKLNSGSSPVVAEEGPAELIMDAAANVISTSGLVSRVELDAASKQRIQDAENQLKFLNSVSKWFGVGRGRIGHQKIVGQRFQFNGYPRQWIPPNAGIEYLNNKQVKITVPPRFSVSSRVREAFAIKDYDQYRYLVAQGLTAINYGMCGRDVISQLKRWDSQYGLMVLQAHWDGVSARLDKLPVDLPGFVAEEKRLCPSIGNGDIEMLKNRKIIAFWWD